MSMDVHQIGAHLNSVSARIRLRWSLEFGLQIATKTKTLLALNEFENEQIAWPLLNTEFNLLSRCNTCESAFPGADNSRIQSGTAFREIMATSRGCALQ